MNFLISIISPSCNLKMTPIKPLTCCIIGQGKLTLDCAKQLLQDGYSILAMISAAPDVRDWAQEQGIPNTGIKGRRHNISKAMGVRFFIQYR